jgi:hypothetical protein
MIFVVVNIFLFFAVRTEFLNVIETSFGFKGLNTLNNYPLPVPYLNSKLMNCMAASE